MEKIRTFALASLQKIMFLFVLHWLFVSVGVLDGYQAFLVVLVLFLAYLARKKLSFLSSIYRKLMRQKKWILLFAFIFQIILLFSAKLLIRRDAAVVFTGAFEYLKASSISSYITRNPNNLFLFLYERAFYHLFGQFGLWIMLGLNMLYLNGAAVLLYKIGKKHFNQQVADLAFSLYMLLLGFTPFHLTMYTDVVALPLLVIELGFALDLLVEKNNRKTAVYSMGLGMTAGIAYFLRPPSFILLIASLIVIFLKFTWKKLLIGSLVLAMSFGGVYLSIHHLEDSQKEVEIIAGEGLSKSPLSFINLGLTFSGYDQEDMKEGLLQYIEESKRGDYNNGMFAKENILKEIKRRLREYTPRTFIQHLFVKQSGTVMDGGLDWTYFENLKREKTPYVSPLYESTQNQPIFRFARYHFITVDKKEYKTYAFFKQLVWIGLALGLLAACLRYKEDEKISLLQLAIFGGILFLLIFEGGKTRYLIQFIPQILLLSSLGWVNGFSKEK